MVVKVSASATACVAAYKSAWRYCLYVDMSDSVVFIRFSVLYSAVQCMSMCSVD